MYECKSMKINKDYPSWQINNIESAVSLELNIGERVWIEYDQDWYVKSISLFYEQRDFHYSFDVKLRHVVLNFGDSRTLDQVFNCFSSNMKTNKSNFEKAFYRMNSDLQSNRVLWVFIVLLLVGVLLIMCCDKW
jgi:hypothetical protein